MDFFSLALHNNGTQILPMTLVGTSTTPASDGNLAHGKEHRTGNRFYKYTAVAKRQQREEQGPERSDAGNRCPNDANKSEYEKLGD